MIFGKRKRKKEETKKGPQIGDRFAIQYGSISTPVYYEDEHPYYSAIIKTNYHNLNMGDISKLWTVVEFIGDDQYLDLITGEIITSQVDIHDIKDTVTLEYEDEAQEKHDELLEHPLAIGSDGCITQPGLHPLTTEIKQSIVETTMPRQDEVCTVIRKKKEEAKKLIIKMYEKKNRAKMHQLYNEALIEDKKRTAEAERRRREEERRRQEELKRMEEERLRAEIEPKFDAIFPRVKGKIFTKK